MSSPAASPYPRNRAVAKDARTGAHDRSFRNCDRFPKKTIVNWKIRIVGPQLIAFIDSVGKQWRANCLVATHCVGSLGPPPHGNGSYRVRMQLLPREGVGPGRVHKTPHPVFADAHLLLGAKVMLITLLSPPTTPTIMVFWPYFSCQAVIS